MNFKKEYFIRLALVAFFTVLFGVLSHEASHYFAFKMLGYTPTLHFNKVTREKDQTYIFLKEQSVIHQTEIKENKPFKGDKLFYELSDKFKADGFLPTLAGPLVTIIFGTLGFLLLLLSFGNKPPNQKLNIWQWFFVFLSLLWLRQVINIVVFFSPFMNGGDEYVIDYYLNFIPGTSYFITSTLGLILMSYLFLKIIPKEIRLTFLVSVFKGGILGALVWIVWLGNVIII